VLFVEHDQMIGALAPDRPDQTFNMAVLPGRTPAEFEAFLRQDIEKWAHVVKVSGAQIGK
jgi:hypothetical protein